MKVGHIIDGLEVVDVKRVNKMNLIQFTKAVSEYIEMGYKLDVNSSRQVGLVLQMDMYKLESNLSGNVGSVGEVVPIEDSSEEDVVKEPQLTAEAHSGVMLPIAEPEETAIETVETIAEVVEEALSDSDEGAKVEQTTPPVKKTTRSKKTT